MNLNKELSVFWFRRDLRLDDNAGLFQALNSSMPVLPIFIFDREILDKLDNRSDRRVEFIYKQLSELNKKLNEYGSSLYVLHDAPLNAWKKLTREFNIKAVYLNNDYEPDAVLRDNEIQKYLESIGAAFHSYKDQVIFEKDEILNNSGRPYTVFTPYSRKWINTLKVEYLHSFKCEKYYTNFLKLKKLKIPNAEELGFKFTGESFPSHIPDKNVIKNYDKIRNDLSAETTKIGIHLRFGTVSIRKLVKLALKYNNVWLNELIWREFFMSIIYHFPHSALSSFKREYDDIKWLNDEDMFDKWCNGLTGYPLVDAGMRELNSSGFMHNRTRMVTASFLVKHLLIDWRWGERYFADKLLDYELSSNNGNWQWAASTGCDASPYFRVFNPTKQITKFDPELMYIKKWVPEIDSPSYPSPVIDHKLAYERAIRTYKDSLSKFSALNKK